MSEEGNISFNMFHGLIDNRLGKVLSGIEEETVTEIRLRSGKPLVVFQDSVKIYPSLCGGKYIVLPEDIERVLGIATDFSMYSVGDKLTKGFLTKDGMRIGVGGVGVVEDGKLITIKDVASLVIRIPRQIKGCADMLMSQILNGSSIKSVLVISPPGAGKTTLLRDLARQISYECNTIVIDERKEFSAGFDLGESEVLENIPKTLAYEFAIRTMSPQVIVTDEIFSQREIDAVKDVLRCGVKMLASVHGENLASITRHSLFKDIKDAFDVFVTLAPIGKIVSVDYE